VKGCDVDRICCCRGYDGGSARSRLLLRVCDSPQDIRGDLLTRAGRMKITVRSFSIIILKVNLLKPSGNFTYHQV
jgi:hypothetical protein